MSDEDDKSSPERPEEEAHRLKTLAEAQYSSGDLNSALNYANRAHDLHPSINGLSEMLTALKILLGAAATPLSGTEKSILDYYRILQVERFSHINLVKKQYKKLALTLHPDKNPSAASEEAFKLVGEAARVLSDKVRRKEYDMKLRIAMQLEAAEEVGWGTEEAGETFPTACSACRVLHQFDRKYLGHNLMCPNCKKTFKAMEVEEDRSNAGGEGGKENNEGIGEGQTRVSARIRERVAKGEHEGVVEKFGLGRKRKRNVGEVSERLGAKVTKMKKLDNVGTSYAENELRSSTVGGKVRGAAGKAPESGGFETVESEKLAEDSGEETMTLSQMRMLVVNKKKKLVEDKSRIETEVNGKKLETKENEVNIEEMEMEVEVDKEREKDKGKEMTNSLEKPNRRRVSRNRERSSGRGDLEVLIEEDGEGKENEIEAKEKEADIKEMETEVEKEKEKDEGKEMMNLREKPNRRRVSRNRERTSGRGDLEVLIEEDGEGKENEIEAKEKEVDIEEMETEVDKEREKDKGKEMTNSLEKPNRRRVSRNRERSSGRGDLEVLIEEDGEGKEKEVDIEEMETEVEKEKEKDEGKEMMNSREKPNRRRVSRNRERSSERGDLEVLIEEDGKGKENEIEAMRGKRVRRRTSKYGNLDFVKTNNTSMNQVGTEIERLVANDKGSLGIMPVEDSEFYDFDKDRKERSFKKGQVWAVYDDDDGMPRHYGLIDRVDSLNPFQVTLIWLRLKSNKDEELLSWLNTGYHVSCGIFQLSRKVAVKYLNLFSHIVDCERATKELYRIYPKKGSVWAMYKNNAPQNSEIDQGVKDTRSYDIVILLSNYDDMYGLSVGCLEKVPGFRTVFRRKEVGANGVICLGPKDVKLLSHQIPAKKLSGDESSGLPKDCWELDPASLTPKLLMAS